MLLRKLAKLEENEEECRESLKLMEGAEKHGMSLEEWADIRRIEVEYGTVAMREERDRTESRWKQTQARLKMLRQILERMLAHGDEQDLNPEERAVLNGMRAASEGHGLH